ncbi:sex hormone-binding globulin-like [Engystomops pustulosus]|uniref:sex hormone-binding globulin-like n=1 Tax=Engystomops pustulosus TaxID=76066 RepID=UPI003AFA799F
MTTVIFLLILLLHKCRAETRSCHGGFLDPRTSMHIGQNWGHDLPAGTVHIDLHRVTRPFSAFEVRTYDPEGVLIFGDTAGGREWFLLGLRNGRPEIQIHNQFAKVTINGGRRINDGAWHKVVVRSDDHRIVLEVDEEQSLRIGHVTEGVTQSLQTIMRISVGGILINRTELLEPVSDPLLCCIKVSLNVPNNRESVSRCTDGLGIQSGHEKKTVKVAPFCGQG